MDNNQSTDIEIARLAFIGASISALGDGISALAAGLALASLERQQKVQNPSHQLPQSQKHMDYLINELIQLRNIIHKK